MSRLARQLALLALVVPWMPGCAREGLPTEYGSRSGPDSNSVNGTSVLADMFTAAGHRVSTATWLSPRIRERSEVIVWFPNDFDVPTEKVRDWLEGWLREGRDRTLIYVDRDYDAAPTYWRSVLEEKLSDEDRKLAEKELERAEERFSLGRKRMPDNADCGWFSQRAKLEHRDVRELNDNTPWRAGVDAKRLGIELNGRIRPVRRAKPLLSSGTDILASQRRMSDGKLIVVANGSFLLNLPLVNHEHRKLAGKLVESVGREKKVVFLESGVGGPTILDEDPSAQDTSGLAILGTEPFDIPLLHFAWAGVVFCLARFPIFGRPREWIVGQLSDFGAHITALGKLLQRTKDRTFAGAALERYRHAISPGAARTSAPPPTIPAQPVVKPAIDPSEPSR